MFFFLLCIIAIGLIFFDLITLYANDTSNTQILLCKIAISKKRNQVNVSFEILCNMHILVSLKQNVCA